MNLEKFVDELPIPEVAEPVKNPRQTYYEIAMEEVFLKVHRDLPQPSYGPIMAVCLVQPLKRIEMKRSK